MITLTPAITSRGVTGLENSLRETKGANSDFSNFLDKAIQSVNDRQVNADQQLLNVASGENVDLHNQMIALEEANISLRTMASVRDKIVDAYHTIWNMQV